jgi:hypothetical protein
MVLASVETNRCHGVLTSVNDVDLDRTTLITDGGDRGRIECTVLGAETCESSSERPISGADSPAWFRARAERATSSAHDRRMSARGFASGAHSHH